MQRIKKKTSKPLIKYASALNRAVRRQILINAHKKAQIRNFKINSAMILGTEQKVTIKDAQVKNSRISFMLEQILLDRVNEYLIVDEIEGLSVIF